SVAAIAAIAGGRRAIGRAVGSRSAPAAAIGAARAASAARLALRRATHGAVAGIARVQYAIDERQSLAVGDRHRDRRRPRGGLVFADDDEAMDRRRFVDPGGGDGRGAGRGLRLENGAVAATRPLEHA